MSGSALAAGRPGKSYDAFISYSHAADDRLAPQLQRGLQRFAKSWRQRRALDVFRDRTGLSVNPDLWAGITAALDHAEWFIYLASPAAAASEWVGREISRWLDTKDPGHVLVVLTDGEWRRDAARNQFDESGSSAIHPALVRAFTSEPLVLDLRWAHSSERLSLRDRSGWPRRWPTGGCSVQRFAASAAAVRAWNSPPQLATAPPAVTRAPLRKARRARWEAGGTRGHRTAPIVSCRVGRVFEAHR